MSEFPRLTNGRLPVGPKRNRQYSGGVSDWKTWRLRDAMVVGVEKEIDDKIVGRIPARVPLPLETAARAVNLGIRKARQLVQEPEFKADLKSAIEDYRKTLEPGSIAMALSIRDDPSCAPKERLKAAEFLYGPKAATGVTVNVQQNNATLAHPAGYCINLGTPMKDLDRVAIEEKIIEAPAPDRYSGGPSDVERERAEAARVRPSRG